MNTTSVRHSVDVDVDVATAFDVWVRRIGDWWPREHTIGAEPKAGARIEPGVGGAVVEVGVHGAECRWGTVLEWEPPTRLVIAWQITPDWRPEPDIARSSEFEVLFSPIDGSTTRVVVEHRHFERHGDGGEQVRSAVDGPQGWPHVLNGFAQLATG